MIASINSNQIEIAGLAIPVIFLIFAGAVLALIAVVLFVTAVLSKKYQKKKRNEDVKQYNTRGSGTDAPDDGIYVAKKSGASDKLTTSTPSPVHPKITAKKEESAVVKNDAAIREDDIANIEVDDDETFAVVKDDKTHQIMSYIDKSSGGEALDTSFDEATKEEYSDDDIESVFFRTMSISATPEATNEEPAEEVAVLSDETNSIEDAVQEAIEEEVQEAEDVEDLDAFDIPEDASANTVEETPVVSEEEERAEEAPADFDALFASELDSLAKDDLDSFDEFGFLDVLDELSDIDSDTQEESVPEAPEVEETTLEEVEAEEGDEISDKLAEVDEYSEADILDVDPVSESEDEIIYDNDELDVAEAPRQDALDEIALEENFEEVPAVEESDTDNESQEDSVEETPEEPEEIVEEPVEIELESQEEGEEDVQADNIDDIDLDDLVEETEVEMEGSTEDVETSEENEIQTEETQESEIQTEEDIFINDELLDIEEDLSNETSTTVDAPINESVSIEESSEEDEVESQEVYTEEIEDEDEEARKEAERAAIEEEIRQRLAAEYEAKIAELKEKNLTEKEYLEEQARMESSARLAAEAEIARLAALNMAAQTANVAKKEDDDDEDDEDETRQIVASVYKRSFMSKLIQADEAVKEYYSAIKNELMSYDKMRESLSVSCETYVRSRKTFAKITMSGKTLSLYLNLDPIEFNPANFHHKDKSDNKKYAAVPMMVKVRSDLGMRKAISLIMTMMGDNGINKNPAYKAVDYKNELAYKSDEELLVQGLIKYNVSALTDVSQDVTEDDVKAEVAYREQNNVYRSVAPVKKSKVGKTTQKDVIRAVEKSVMGDVADERNRSEKGKFVVCKEADGYKFTLYNPQGKVLFESVYYKTLEAVGGAIEDFIEAAADEYNFALNGFENKFIYILRGKSTFTSLPFATKISCLNTISAIRTVSAEAEIVQRQTVAN